MCAEGDIRLFFLEDVPHLLCEQPFVHEIAFVMLKFSAGEEPVNAAVRFLYRTDGQGKTA